MAKANLNINELKGIIEFTLDNNVYLQENGKVPTAINVEGEAGLGKTSAIKQVVGERNIQIIRRNLAEIEELGDLVGFPTKLHSLRKGGDTIWVDDATVDFYKNQGYEVTGESKMSYSPPEWIVNVDKDQGGILLLDDFTRADPRFMQATMTLIETQSYASWKLPKGWTIVLTTNPDNGEYQVSSLDTAQQTRFLSVNLKFNLDCWAKWAESEGIDGRCINFLLMHPELVTKDVNPRSITTFFNSISSIDDFEKHLPLIQILGEGSVGTEFANLFSMFINNRLDKLISPAEMLFEIDEEKLINSLKRTIGKDDKYRGDIAATLSARLINYSLHYAEDNIINNDIISRIATLVKEEIFNDDLKYNIVKRIYAGNKVKFKMLTLDKSLVKYVLA